MWMLIKMAWRNLFRQRRRTLITVSAMAVSLWLAIPTWGLTEGLTKEMIKGITRLELGHIQVHDPAYPKGKALQSTLDRPEHLLKIIRGTTGVKAAAPRVHGYALASNDEHLKVAVVGLAASSKARRREAVLFGRPIDPQTPWRRDRALACEAVVGRAQARKYALVVGTVLTPKGVGADGRCERVKVVGLLRDALPGTRSEDGTLTLGLASKDAAQAFGGASRRFEAVVRHSAPVAVMGVVPAEERKVTFMADKLVQGRYLSTAKPGRGAPEIVVGYRLARTMHLTVGGTIFIQAAALDNTQGTFYQDFRVVGIYRTGVDMIDRIRVFIRLQAAQRIMTLGDRVHEIAIIGPNPRAPGALVSKLRARLKTRLRVVTRGQGTRAGSRPLPAPVTVYEPSGDSGDAALIIPYDLKRRFDDVKGVEAVAKRVYARTRVRRVRAQPVRVELHPAAWLRERGAQISANRCAIYVPRALAGTLGLTAGAVRVLQSAATGALETCPQVTVAGLLDSAAPTVAPPPATKSEPVVYGVQRAEGAQSDDEQPVLDAGAHTLLQVEKGRSLRLVGVEPAYEDRLSGLSKHIATGRSLPAAGKVGVTRPGYWPVLLSQRAAKGLGLTLGAAALLDVRDGDGHGRQHAVEVVGLLADQRWPAALPALVMPYYQAQQVDAKHLNARAHEMLLVLTKPKEAPQVAALAREQLKPLVRSWKQIQPDLAKLLQTQDLWIGIMLFIIFALAALTVMNTMLMAVWERTREFGVLKSIGMRPRQVFGLIVLETLALSVFAVAVGGGGGVLLNHWAVVTGIDLSQWTSGFTYQGTFIDPVWRAAHTVKATLVPMVMVQLVCVLVSIYPAVRAGRLKPVVALRHHA